jgi:hypothetical protein
MKVRGCLLGPLPPPFLPHTPPAYFPVRSATATGFTQASAATFPSARHATCSMVFYCAPHSNPYLTPPRWHCGGLRGSFGRWHKHRQRFRDLRVLLLWGPWGMKNPTRAPSPHTRSAHAHTGSDLPCQSLRAHLKPLCVLCA